MTTHNPTEQVASRDCRERKVLSFPSSPVWGEIIGWAGYGAIVLAAGAAVYGLGEVLWWAGVRV